MRCCSESSVLSPRRLGKVQKKLDQLAEALPGRVSCVILSPAGTLIARSTHDNQPIDNWLPRISLLKRSLLDFGDVLGDCFCPAVHIKGERHVVSCYDLNENVIAMITEMHETSIEFYSPEAAEAEVLPLLTGFDELLSTGTAHWAQVHP
ncbi:hypothetical protein CYMTET_41567 [Cymbomonas tetramitiformis]|uniref:Uncharacterized protein n=1 Tax=Cymbomonas tetramitiformis TaxID=36881 RepID=A0AAE0C5U3_9CHLO|nr:hypothetical protein CYMTET_41567 [Cymbomonas tetramitiformis]